MDDESNKQDLQNFSQMMKEGLSQPNDPREKAYSEIAGFLFDFSKLNFVSRLSPEQVRIVLANKIVISFYQAYYSQVKVKITLVKTDDPPYYKKEYDYGEFTDSIRKDFLNKYPALIDDYMSIMVSLQGGGRKEALKVLEGSNNAIEDKKWFQR